MNLWFSNSSRWEGGEKDYGSYRIVHFQQAAVKGQDTAHKLYLHFDPAVYRLKDFSVADGMDLNQES